MNLSAKNSSKQGRSRLENLSYMALSICALLGLLGVISGAFGAHALRHVWRPLADASIRMQRWELAARYQMHHVAALGVIAILVRYTSSKLLWASFVLMTAGVLLFSGSLYILAWSADKTFAYLTPFGGLCLIGGWASLLCYTVQRLRRRSESSSADGDKNMG